jgi:hypothetical protein
VSRREAWLSAIGIFAFALAVRVVAAGIVVFPIPEDTAYYVGVARNLAEGRGLLSDALWSYGTPPLVLPRPAFEIWLPLPTLLIAPLMAVFGASFRAAQVVPVVVGALVPVLAWRLAADVAAERRLPVGRARTLALGVGITACMELPLLLHSTLPDSTMLFAALAIGACILMERIIGGVAREAAVGPGETSYDGDAINGIIGSGVPQPPGVGDAINGITGPVGALPPGLGDAINGITGKSVPQPPGRDDARRSIDGTTAKLVGLGLLLGMAALTRNEAIWLALTWVIVVLTRLMASDSGLVSDQLTRRHASRLRLIGIPAIVAIAVFAPWAIRDWIVFGSPFPGQALSNALFVTGHDVYAYLDPPTLSRYLAQGWSAIVQAHVDGVVHNLVNVLLVPSFPIGAIGLIGLLATPWTKIHRSSTLRPLLIVSIITFAVTTILFPVTTTWGTFLHASGPVQVLLLVSCLLVLDLLIVRIGTVRGWTRPVAWLGPTLTTATAVLFSIGIVAFGAQSAAAQDRYEAIGKRLATLGADAGRAGPIIGNFPIFLAESQRAPTLGLPNEPPENVVDLAQRFGARYLVMSGTWGTWPAVIDQPVGGTSPRGVACFHEVTLPPPADPAQADALKDTRIWEIACP